MSYYNNRINMSFYNNAHFESISKKLMDNYMNEAISNNLTNTRTLNLTGGSIRRQYEYIPRSFIESREAEGRKPILNATNVITPSNYNFGGAANMGGVVYRTRGMRGGDIWGDIGKFFRPVASAALDLAAPAAGMFMGGPAGAVMATGARQGLKAVTGFGRGKRGGKKKAGVGVYGGSMNASGGAMSGGCDGDMACAPCAAKAKKGAAKTAGAHPIGARLAGAKTAGAMSAGKKKGNRMDMVKKVMKEKGLSLGAASKFIKDNNLY